MENVKGFEESETRKKLLDSLQKAQFNYEEYLLNPLQFGICNSRLRYYLLAKKSTKVSMSNHETQLYKIINLQYLFTHVVDAVS